MAGKTSKKSSKTTKKAGGSDLPDAWSAKDKRQYEHVKESEQERGSSRAKEIAARTVNKQRREEGRTKAQKGE